MFFFLPLIASFAAFAVLQQTAIGLTALWTFLILQGLGVGPFHAGNTWVHFYDRNVRRRIFGWGRRTILVIGLMAAVVVLTMLGMVWNSRAVMALFMLATIHHVVQQNAGILLLYHNHSREAVPSKVTETRTLYTSACVCSFLFLWRFSSHASLQQTLFLAGALVSLLLFACYTKDYAFDHLRQVRSGLPLNGAALLFWLISVSFLLPFAFFGNDFNQAVLPTLVMHWFQYIGLNWVLFRRKESADARGRKLIRQLFMISFAWAFVILAVGAYATLALAPAGTGDLLISGFVLGMAMLHYVQDGLIWRLRDPVLRKRLLPFLKPAGATATVGAETVPASSY